MLIKKGEPLVLSTGEVLDADTRVGIFDAAGQILPYVQSFDTQTCEVWMIIMLKNPELKEVNGKVETTLQVVFGDDDKPFIAKFVLPGAYAMDDTGRKLV